MSSPTNIHNIQDLVPLADELFVKSIVYDFLRRTKAVHAKIAFEFKLRFGPFKDLDGLTLEKLYDMYKNKIKVISTDTPMPSTSQRLYKSNKKVGLNKPENIPKPSTSHTLTKSDIKMNSLVFEYLARKKHFDTAIDFQNLVGPLKDVRKGPVLEDMLTHYMQLFEELELDDEFSDDTSAGENFEEISVFNVKYVPKILDGVVEIEAITNGIHKIRSKNQHRFTKCFS